MIVSIMPFDYCKSLLGDWHEKFVEMCESLAKLVRYPFLLTTSQCVTFPQYQPF